ncbi:MAG TPA: substrate-binding domain-containing protein [Solirubrobacteraceae bacterium]|nr:substrate-binding domain-containing protein [Solirubrobacteraceae bacterium]
MRAGRKLSGLLALGVVGAMALTGAFGAGSAMAEEPGEQCAGANPTEGQGSSLQKTAQEIWGAGFNTSANGSACNGTQGSKAKPVVKYSSTGSGAGKTVWGAEKAGNKPKDGKKENPAESGDVFVGSDEPLTPAQMKNVDEAAGGTEQTLVVPVEQAAVAVIVNPPAECLITKITNANLQAIWNGTITEWSGVTGGKAEGAGVTEDTAGACKSAIKRIARLDSSGTTFVFKSYLFEILKTATCSGKTWAEYAAPAENTNWPEEPAGTCKGKVTHAAKSGGGGEAEEVEKTSGSIGYANLADARAKFTDETGDHYHWVGVQNQIEAGFYPNPGTSTGEPSLTTGESNCKGTHYGELPKVGADDDWSKVSGAHTKLNANYPICTLTYDVALMNYTLAVYSKPAEEAKAVYDYINYAVAPGGGQTDLAGHDYHEVEEAVGKFAQEEALLIAEGSDVAVEASTFDLVENLSLLTFGAEKVLDIIFQMKAGLKWAPALRLSPGGEGKKFDIITDLCTGHTFVPIESCLIEIEKLTAGLEFVFDGNRNILHIE